MPARSQEQRNDGKAGGAAFLAPGDNRLQGRLGQLHIGNGRVFDRFEGRLGQLFKGIAPTLVAAAVSQQNNAVRICHEVSGMIRWIGCYVMTAKLYDAVALNVSGSG